MSQTAVTNYQVVKAYPQGTFSWLDLSTTDVQASKAFYTQLFGWEAVDVPAGGDNIYTMLKQDGHDVAGLGQMMPEQQAQGIPSHWTSYISVDNAEAIVAKVTAAGGTVVVPPFPVMDAGIMAVLQDPTGAMVAVWEAKNHIGAQLVNVPNSLVWNELWTRDVEGAAAFYQDVFGWEGQLSGDEPPYYAFLNNGRMAGGVMAIEPEWGEMPPMWSIYIAVADCEAMMAKTKALGGTVMMGPIAAAEVGTFAMIQDPTGAMITVIEMNQVDAPPGY